MKTNKKGQALVLILVLATVMAAVTSAAVAMVVTSSQVTSQAEISAQALAAAESGAENALLLLLRDPYGYLGETMNFFDESAAEVVISPGDYPKTLVSTGRFRGFVRKLEISLTYFDNELGLSFWREVYQ